MQILFQSPIASDPQLLRHYRVVENNKLSIQSKKEITKFHPGKQGHLATETLMSFWCFNPAIAMKNLSALRPRSIILASGTLSPLNTLSDEFGLAFPNRVENSHVINSSQILIGVLKTGPNGNALNSTFGQRDNAQYMNDLGLTVLDICKKTPGGILCFFTSYSVMTNVLSFWERIGPTPSIMNQITKIKCQFRESKSKDDFTADYASYENVINNGMGAILFAVFRGKASEGIDFSDNKARGVIICGLPYPATADPKVRLKTKILNENGRDNNVFYSNKVWKNMV